MIVLSNCTALLRMLSIAALLAGSALPSSLLAQEPERTKPEAPTCHIDLQNPGEMKDIVSNALRQGLKQNEAKTRAFLYQAETRYPTGEDLLRAAAKHFGLEEAVLSASVEEYRHCNCEHARSAEPSSSVVEPIQVSPFARDVLLHVVLHELGHALIREFDLPILANEETMADAFATYFVTTYWPERALPILLARTNSLMIEAQAEARETWTMHGEHNHDARRASQIAALAIAADPQKYAPLAAVVGMTERNMKSAADYGSEIHRSWRRVLAPLWMPHGMQSREARVVRDSSDPILLQLSEMGFADEIEAVLKRFDWHSQVSVVFASGDGGASWSRSKRSVTVHSEYVRRFVEQGASMR